MASVNKEIKEISRTKVEYLVMDLSGGELDDGDIKQIDEYAKSISNVYELANRPDSYGTPREEDYPQGYVRGDVELKYIVTEDDKMFLFPRYFPNSWYQVPEMEFSRAQKIDVNNVKDVGRIRYRYAVPRPTVKGELDSRTVHGFAESKYFSMLDSKYIAYRKEILEPSLSPYFQFEYPGQ